MFKAKIIGKEQIEGFVQGLKDIDKDKAINQGLKKGGLVLSRGGKRRLTSSMKNPIGRTGNLLKSFNVRTKRKKLGVLIGFKRPIGNHSHLLDKGTNDRYTAKGFNRGSVQSTKFWTDTKNSDMANASNEIFNGIKVAVSKIKNRNR